MLRACRWEMWNKSLNRAKVALKYQGTGKANLQMDSLNRAKVALKCYSISLRLLPCRGLNRAKVALK